MPKSVEKFISKLKSKGYPEGSAIAIGKSKGLIAQKGKHLGAGPKMPRGSGRGK